MNQPTVIPNCQVLQPTGVGANGIPYNYRCDVFEKDTDPLADPRLSSKLFEEIRKIEDKIKKIQASPIQHTIADDLNQISSYESQIRGLNYKKSVIDKRIKYQNLEAKDALNCLELGYSVLDCKNKYLRVDEVRNWLLGRGEQLI